MAKLFSGLLGNLSEVSSDTLTKEYGGFLVDGERIALGFKLIRDSVLFTDKRIIFIDKQGATGKKTRYFRFTLILYMMFQLRRPVSAWMTAK